MSDDKIGGFRLFIGFSKSLLLLSTLVITSGVMMAVFSATAFEAQCICTINYLAYSWIAFAISALLAMATWICAVFKENCNCNERKYTLLKWLTIIEALAFISGIIFLLVFVTRYTNVV